MVEHLWSGFTGLIVGVGLAAACGFRILIPFLGLSIAAATGHIQPAPEFQWIGTQTALLAFAAAAILEIAAYSVPWIDNLLDAAATPLATAAGVIATAAVLTDVSPFLKWTIALIAGGGMAGTISTGTALLRGASTASTGGAANPILAAAEFAGSVLTTLLSLLAPIVGLIFAILAAVAVMMVLRRRRRRRAACGQGAGAGVEAIRKV
jgi:hypothetical protein